MHSDESWKTTSAVVRIAAGTGTILIEALSDIIGVCEGHDTDYCKIKKLENQL